MNRIKYPLAAPAGLFVLLAVTRAAPLSPAGAADKEKGPRQFYLGARQRIQLAALALGLLCASAWLAASSRAQSIDRTQNPNAANAGIAKSLAEEIGAGRGDVMTPDSSAFVIMRDPFRAIRRGRQLFQRKFLRSQGVGPLSGDGVGDINNTLALGAGLVDSCAGCHGRPRGAAGSGGDVVTRPDSRDAPHLFGLGLKEMLADEITADLRAIRQQAVDEARRLISR